MPQTSQPRTASPYRAQEPYIFPSPITSSSADQHKQHGMPAEPVLLRNQSVPRAQRSHRRTRSFASVEGSPHISFQRHESRPPLRFYVDDAIHELFSHKQKSPRSKGGAFSILAGLFTCWNPTKKQTMQAEARTLSASKRVSQLLETSRRQQSELADKQDTIDMLEWQLEQMQVLALMDSDKEPARSCVIADHGLAVLQDRGISTCNRSPHRSRESRNTAEETGNSFQNIKAQAKEQEIAAEQYAMTLKTEEKENKKTADCAVPASQRKPEEKYIIIKPKIELQKENKTSDCGAAAASQPKAEEKHITLAHGGAAQATTDEEDYALRDCKLKVEKKENKQPLGPEAGGDVAEAPLTELHAKQVTAAKCEEQEDFDKESTMATLLLFEMATMRARFSIRSFSKALIKQMEASGYSVLRTLSELEPNVAFTKKEHVVYTLESRINKAFFHCFENDSFDDSGLMQILDPETRCATRLDEFQRMKLVEVDDVVNANHPSFDPEFRRFCQRKTKELWSQFSWHIAFSSVEDREVFTAAFLDAAKSVWLLHRLAFSVNPHVLILRVGKGLEINPVYVEAVPNLGGPDSLCQVCGKSKVEFLIMPGFQAMGKVVKCQVYQHVQCLID